MNTFMSKSLGLNPWRYKPKKLHEGTVAVILDFEILKEKFQLLCN